MTEFRETYNLFQSALMDMEYTNYWEWMLLPDDFKAVALYVNFYDEITLAWSKTVKPFMEEETAISTLMQYLLKNVLVVQSDKKRFTKSYFYKIAFNVFYPLGRIKRDVEEWKNTRSLYENINTYTPTDDYDEDNLIYTESRYTDRAFVEATDILSEANKKAIWEIIDSCDDETQKLIDYLINGHKLGKRLAAKAPEILSELRHLLCIYCD